MARTRAGTKYRGRQYRSKFEVRIAQQLYDMKCKFTYEAKSYPYLDPIARARCNECNSKEVYVSRMYTPDFFLSNGCIIEAKGKLDAQQRKKLLAVQKCNPDLDVHILFMRDNKISSQSKTRYMEWATKHGFKCAVSTIPKGWMKNV